MRRIPNLIFCSEQGVILVFMAIALTAVVAIAGLAIDAGRLYREQLALQNAADAAALACINYTLQKEKDEFMDDVSTYVSGNPTALKAQGYEAKDPITAFLHAKAQDLVNANLGKTAQADKPLKIESIYTPPSNYSSNNDTVYSFEVKVQGEVDLVLLDVLPFIKTSSYRLGASATAERKVANVAIVVDASKSMECPADQSNNCDCLATDSCPKSDRKIDELVKAVKAFLKMFDMSRDRISLVAFSLVASPPVVVAEGDNGPEVTFTEGGTTVTLPLSFFGDLTDEQVEGVIDRVRTSWEPNGNTNICDGLMTAWGAMQDIAPGAKSAFVLFSDGGPTANRALYDKSAVAKLPKWSTPEKFGDYDYVHYTINWKTDSGVFYGPSVLAQTGLIRFDHRDPVPPVGGPYPRFPEIAEVPSNASIGCGPSDAPIIGAADQTADAATLLFSGGSKPCLTSLKAHLPGSPTVTYNSDYVAGGSPGVHDFRETYYNCAIELSNFLIGNKATMHVIGLGADMPKEAYLTDDQPYKLDYPTYRNDEFLARLANDNYVAHVKKGKDGTVNNYPPFTYSEYKDYDHKDLARIESRGTYLATTDPLELKALFGRLGAQIKLSLIE